MVLWRADQQSYVFFACFSIQESFGSKEFEVQNQSSSELLSNLRHPNFDSNSVLVIEHDGCGPYCHFAPPIGGPAAPNDEMRHDIAQRRNSSFASFVPEVLPIQLPTGKEALLDAASPVITRPKVSATANLSRGTNSKSAKTHQERSLEKVDADDRRGRE